MPIRKLIDIIFGNRALAQRRAMGYGKGMTFSELLAQTDDYNLASGTFCLIDAPYFGCFDATQYTDVERPIMLTWHASGIIGNGGFEYLFKGPWKGDPNYSMTVAAHKEIGLTERYDAFVRALSAFPGGKPSPLDEKEKHAVYMAVPEDQRAEINRIFWQAESKEIKIAAYIRQNVERLQHLHGRVS